MCSGAFIDSVAGLHPDMVLSTIRHLGRHQRVSRGSVILRGLYVLWDSGPKACYVQRKAKTLYSKQGRYLLL